MAEAVKEYRVEHRPVVVTKYEEVKVSEVTLKLTDAEAEALIFVLGKVGGEPDRTPRRHTDSVFAALESAGVRWSPDCDAARGAIIFEREFKK